MITGTKPIPCTFMDAWEHMKKHPDKPVCVFGERKYKLCSSSDCIVIETCKPGCDPDGIFDLYYDRDILDGEWQLIPQGETE